MHLCRWLAVAMIACLPAAAFGQEKKPEANSKELDKATIAVWEKKGFEVGWLREEAGRAQLYKSRPKGTGAAIPAVWYDDGRRLTAEDLKDLPPVEVPFALRLWNINENTDEALKHFTKFPNLIWLNLGSARITEQGFKHLEKLKNLT